jgi:hypothetical protein
LNNAKDAGIETLTKSISDILRVNPVRMQRKRDVKKAFTMQKEENTRKGIFLCINIKTDRNGQSAIVSRHNHRSKLSVSIPSKEKIEKEKKKRILVIVEQYVIRQHKKDEKKRKIDRANK